MKQFAILFAAVCAMTCMASESQAQCAFGGGGVGFAPVRSSGFSLSIGNGFNQFGYSNFAAPIVRPVYARPVYGGYGGFYGGPIHRGYGGYGRGVSVGISRGFGGYGGFRPGCGGW
jgi:hypothetical protein